MSRSAASPGRPSATGSAPAQPCANRVLTLLRKLIDYGQDLARTVQQRAAAGTLFTLALRFGTKDVALILARISRGLQLATALEARLVSHPPRPDAVPAPLRAPSDRVRRTAQPRVRRPSLPDLPTAAEIAAALRHRPAAAVIADICRDLGIVPAHPLWRDVMVVLSGHGGNFVAFFKDVVHRLFTAPRDPSPVDADEWPALGPHPAAACGTGPPA